MKILVFTDSHNSTLAKRKIIEKAKKYKPELLLCAGDFTIFMQHAKEELRWIDNLKIKGYIIHGNHEDERSIKALCMSLKNVEFIHNKAARYKNILIFGYGGGGFSTKDVEFNAAAKEFEKSMDECKECKKILLLHQPPHKSRIDLVYGEFAGNKTTKQFADKHKIELVLAGHLHENSGKDFIIKKTRFVNPGPWGKIIEI
jgi:uncharacterized protein